MSQVKDEKKQEKTANWWNWQFVPLSPQAMQLLRDIGARSVVVQEKPLIGVEKVASWLFGAVSFVAYVVMLLVLVPIAAIIQGTVDAVRFYRERMDVDSDIDG